MGGKDETSEKPELANLNGAVPGEEGKKAPKKKKVKRDSQESENAPTEDQVGEGNVENNTKKSKKKSKHSKDTENDQPEVTSPPDAGEDKKVEKKKKKNEDKKYPETNTDSGTPDGEATTQKFPSKKSKKKGVKSPSVDIPPEVKESAEVPTPEAPSENTVTQGESTSRPLSGSVVSNARGDIQFVEELDVKYKCICCSNVLRVPILFEDCGHRCCSSCLPTVLRGNCRCPSDGVHLKQELIKVDKEFQLEMDELAVRCSFAKEGCEWTGKLAQLGSHLAQCDYKTVTCPNDCGVEFEQRFLEKHIKEDCPKRLIRCKFCDSNLIAANELKHIQICPKFLVPCPNGCKTGEMPREQLTEHLANGCSKQDHSCPFEAHGCTFRARKKKLEPHLLEASIEHLTMLNNSVQQMTLLLEAQTKSFTELKQLTSQQAKRITAMERVFGSSFTWKIDNYTEKFNMAKSGKQLVLFSPPFYTHRGGYRMALSVCLYGSGENRGKFMGVFACLCRGENDALLPWPFTNQLTFTLIDQNPNVAARRHVDYVIKPNPTSEHAMFLGRPTSERNACFGAPRFCRLDVLKFSDYIVDEAMFVKVNMNLDDLPSL